MNLYDERQNFKEMIKHAWDNKTYEEESLNNLTFNDFYKKMNYFYTNNRAEEYWAIQFSFCNNNIVRFYESGYEVHQFNHNLQISSYEPIFNSSNEDAAKFILLVEKKLKALLNKYNKFIRSNEGFLTVPHFLDQI